MIRISLGTSGFATLVAACISPLSADAATINATPANYQAALSALNPGDMLNLASGTYSHGLPISNLNGTASQTIVIRGPDDQSAVFTAEACCNTVQFDTSSYVEVRNLTLNGAGQDGPSGVDTRGPTHHITIENLKIINYGADQQDVGISTKGPAWNWTIRHNTIIGAGTGIYLGNSDGAEPFVAGLIEQNLIVDSIGYAMEIKHQIARPTNIGMPITNNKTIIRHNVFSKSNNSSSGGLARPNLLVGHFPTSGNGSNDLYEIYGNFFYQNPSEALFQGEGNIALYDNVFFNSFGDAVNIEPQHDVPRSVTVFQNTVVAAGNGLRVAGASASFTQKIVGNVSFAGVPVSGPNQSANIIGTYANAVNSVNNPGAAIGTLDLFPKTGQLAGAAIDMTAFSGYTDSGSDFNGTVRTGTIRGAYEGQGTNSGWKLALTIKPLAAAPAPVPAPAPTVSLSATPVQTAAGGTASLQWNSSNASSCQASGGWSGARALSGTENTPALTVNTSFSLSCSGSGGTATQSVSISILPLPTVSIAAAATSVTSGTGTTLTWSSGNATNCTASDGWSGGKALNGSRSLLRCSILSCC